MKKSILILIAGLFSFPAFSQLLSWTPAFPTSGTSSFTITMDASYGNRALLNYNAADVYVHIGVITSLSTGTSDWKHVTTTWGSTDASARAASLGGNRWSFTLPGTLATYFGPLAPGETIQKIAILFRNGNGSIKQSNADGSDMYIPVYTTDLSVRITQPFFQPYYKPIPEVITKSTGESISVTAQSNTNADLEISLNGTVIQTATNTQVLTASPVLNTPGSQRIIARASSGILESSDTLDFFVSTGVPVAPLPPGAVQGINYGNDGTSVTLVLYAPGKSRVSVIGEFAGSNWTEQSTYQMNRTPDGNYWWLTISGLIPGKEYSYQFLVNGTLRIADPYAEKILDPVNDPYITAATYPDLKAYPTGLTTGIVSVLQAGQVPYHWQVEHFNRPDKRNLVIYELLLRDFVAAHDWSTLSDTLNYLRRLGVNAIELMPFNEFEGNISWGYNPNFYFAPDKYYGPAATLKQFIDQCHLNGIAVIMDIALNHSFGSSPMVQLYWDAVNNRPAPDNPWFNPVATHPYNVGYDFNHESAATEYFVSRVVDHWLNDYKLDGFRFDLSKGFTQKVTTNVDDWSEYDPSRIAIWKRYYDTLQLKSPGSYCILEHFAANTEETELADYGMLLWGNENYSYNQASMGYSTDWDFSNGLASKQGWSNPYRDTYMESHDEERMMYKNLTYGNSYPGGYTIKDTATALKRQELSTAFFLTLPGPKMIWQFGEIGYDYSITSCEPGNSVPQPYPQDNCRTDPKPIRWDYLQQSRRKELYDVYARLIQLRFNPLFSGEFLSNSITYSFSGGFKWLKLDKVVVVGNFDVVDQSGSVTFPVSGLWYDYLNGTTITVTGAPYTFHLSPGEYHVYTSVAAALPVTILNFTGKNMGHDNQLNWETSAEYNLDHYEVEKSPDGQHFSTAAHIQANGGTAYSYTDRDGGDQRVTYYRLKTVDLDGRTAYTYILKLESTSVFWKAVVAPNPAGPLIRLVIESPLPVHASVILTDLSGRPLYRGNISIAAGKNEFEVAGRLRLSRGTYLLTLITPSLRQTLKVIKKE